MDELNRALTKLWNACADPPCIFVGEKTLIDLVGEDAAREGIADGSITLTEEGLYCLWPKKKRSLRKPSTGSKRRRRKARKS